MTPHLWLVTCSKSTSTYVSGSALLSASRQKSVSDPAPRLTICVRTPCTMDAMNLEKAQCKDKVQDGGSSECSA